MLEKDDSDPYFIQGNLAGKNNVAFDFDVGNRLREVSTGGAAVERYRYDAHGRRTLASRISGPADSLGVIFSQYANGGPLMYQENTRPGVNKEIDYIYLGGSLIAQREESLATGAVTVKYQHTDALGSPVAVTSDGGGLLERMDYEPYGKVLGTAVAKDGPGYTGHVLDAATGMNYMQQRYYDPQIGRFLSVDPITADGNSGGNFNRYWYANNNPYKFTDPDGRHVREKVGAGGAGSASAEGLSGTTNTTMPSTLRGYGPGVGANGAQHAMVAVSSQGHEKPDAAAAQFGNDTREKSKADQREPQAGIVKIGSGNYGYTNPMWGQKGSTEVNVSTYVDALIAVYGSKAVAFAHGHFDNVRFFSPVDVQNMGSNQIYLSNQQGETRKLNPKLLHREVSNSSYRNEAEFMRGNAGAQGECIDGCL